MESQGAARRLPLRSPNASLLRANPGKPGDAEPRDYSDSGRQVSRAASDAPIDRSRARVTLRRDNESVNADGKRMGVELIVVSAAYIGVMAAVFTRGVQQASRTRREAQPEN